MLKYSRTFNQIHLLINFDNVNGSYVDYYSMFDNLDECLFMITKVFKFIDESFDLEWWYSMVDRLGHPIERHLKYIMEELCKKYNIKYLT